MGRAWFTEDDILDDTMSFIIDNAKSQKGASILKSLTYSNDVMWDISTYVFWLPTAYSFWLRNW